MISCPFDLELHAKWHLRSYDITVKQNWDNYLDNSRDRNLSFFDTVMSFPKIKIIVCTLYFIPFKYAN